MSDTKLTNKPIVFNPKAIVKFAEEGGKLVFKQEAEKELLKLIALKDLLENLIKKAKEDIAQNGKEIDPDFKGVIGRKIKAIYRIYGQKYAYSKNMIYEVEDFLKETKYYKVNSAKVDEYFKEHGKLPDGIFEKDRSPVLSLSLIEGRWKNKCLDIRD